MKKKYIIKKKKTIPIYILVAPVPYGGDYTVRPPLVARASHPSSPVTWYCHISITLYTHIYANRDSVFYFSLSCMSPYVIVKLKTARIHFPVVGFFFFCLSTALLYFYFIIIIIPSFLISSLYMENRGKKHSHAETQPKLSKSDSYLFFFNLIFYSSCVLIFFCVPVTRRWEKVDEMETCIKRLQLSDICLR